MTIMGIAGRVSREMLEHYSHIRLEAKRKALEGLETPVISADTQLEKRKDSTEGVVSQRMSQSTTWKAGTSSKSLKELVGAIRFERPTPCAQGRCATRLRYAPTVAPEQSGTLLNASRAVKSKSPSAVRSVP